MLICGLRYRGAGPYLYRWTFTKRGSLRVNEDMEKTALVWSEELLDIELGPFSLRNIGGKVSVSCCVYLMRLRLSVRLTMHFQGPGECDDLPRLLSGCFERAESAK
jgi:hypothetical protein